MRDLKKSKILVFETKLYQNYYTTLELHASVINYLMCGRMLQKLAYSFQ